MHEANGNNSLAGSRRQCQRYRGAHAMLWAGAHGMLAAAGMPTSASTCTARAAPLPACSSASSAAARRTQASCSRSMLRGSAGQRRVEAQIHQIRAGLRLEGCMASGAAAITARRPPCRPTHASMSSLAPATSAR